jgi:RimJ/RimL family protein N-acetyltransferase
VRLISVYDSKGAEDVLWQLLEERTPEVNISHRRMPTREEHRAFIASRPYAAWYLVEVTQLVDDVALVHDFAGAVYLSRQREIGVGILKRFRGAGIGKAAVQLLMKQHPGERFLANINPANFASRKLFRGLGFHQIQETYELAP